MTRRKDTATEAPAEAEPGSDMPAEDPVAEPAPQPEVSEAATPAAVVAERSSGRSGVMGPLLGGALAALGGFGLSHFNVFGLVAPDQSAEVATLAQRLDAAVTAVEAGQADLESGLRAGIDGLADRLGALEAVPAADLSGLADLDRRLQVIEALPSGADASTAALAAKLATLEQKLAALQTDGAGSAEVDAALARLAEAEAQAKARAAEAQALTEAAAQTQSLRALAAAVALGTGFEAELSAVADPDLQAALGPHVAGVAPVSQLQAEFPEAARAALQIARANDAEAGWGARILDFLGAQTGARSLTPREGPDPDAILSRAEFALGEGRLADAVAELAELDPVVRAPLDGWIAAAGARVAVDAALAGAL